MKNPLATLAIFAAASQPEDSPQDTRRAKPKRSATERRERKKRRKAARAARKNN